MCMYVYIYIYIYICMYVERAMYHTKSLSRLPSWSAREEFLKTMQGTITINIDIATNYY